METSIPRSCSSVSIAMLIGTQKVKQGVQPWMNSRTKEWVESQDAEISIARGVSEEVVDTVSR